jgi:hypothetical protein
MPRRAGVRTGVGAGRARLRTQLAIAGAVLEAGLLWPERGRALLTSFWDGPSIG